MKTKCACLVSSPSQLILRVKPRPQQVCSLLSHVDQDQERQSHPRRPWAGEPEAATISSPLRCPHRSGAGCLHPPASAWRRRRWVPQENRAGTQQAGCWLRTCCRGSFDNIINFSPPAWATLRASFAGGEDPPWGPLCTQGIGRSIYHSPFDVFQMACTAAVSTRNYFITFSDVTGKARLEPPFGC